MSVSTHRANEWRRILAELLDDLRTVSDDDDTPEVIRARLVPVLCELAVLAHKKEV